MARLSAAFAKTNLSVGKILNKTDSGAVSWRIDLQAD